MTADHPCLAVVPIRSFDHTKTRLAGVLSSPERSALARELAGGVLDALAAVDASGLATVVVTDDPTVAAWAAGRGVGVVASTRPGLDGAADAGVAHGRVVGAAAVAVVHADLASPTSLPSVVARPLAADAVRLVPDRHGDGTNVLVLPAAAGFTFRYGPGSFGRHRTEAERRGLRVEVAEAPDLAWDVDEVEDLEHYRSLRQGGPSPA